MSLLRSPAILLRTYPYRETSQILRFFTMERGLLGAIARGSRTRGSKGRELLSNFAEGTLTCRLKEGRDLHTFQEFGVEDAHRGLGGSVFRLAGASLVADLLLRHTQEGASPTLYSQVSAALRRIEAATPDDVVACSLAQAWGVVDSLGFGPVVDHCVVCGAGLEGEELGRFDFSAGGLRCSACSTDFDGPRVGPGARMQLAALSRGEMAEHFSHPRAHASLLADFVRTHVSEGRVLHSFRFFLNLLPHDNA